MPSLQEAPVWDWAAWTIVDGELATQATADLFIPFDTVTDLQSYNTMATQAQTSSAEVLGAAEAIVRDALLAYFQDLAAEEIVPYGEESDFWLWLEYAEHTPNIPATGDITAYLAPLVSQWAAYRGYNPGPNYVAPPPPTLPSPSLGQQSVAKSAQAITPSTVTPGLPQGVSPEAVSAALAVTAVDVLRVVAHVVDDMLPNMAPGQVPQALGQLNQAATVLERQMAGVLSDIDVNVKGSLGAQLNGALETLHGLAQEVNTLAEDVAMKAESTIGDVVNANTAEIGVLSGAVATLVGTAIPDLANGLDSLTSDVGTIDSTLTNTIEPKLATVADQTLANTTELSGTDKECLDQLCDTLNNVTNPIKNGGADAGLLGQLGNLLKKAVELGIVATLADVLVTIADAPIAVSAVVQDTTLLSKWATSAANVIVADYTWLGPLTPKSVASG